MRMGPPTSRFETRPLKSPRTVRTIWVEALPSARPPSATAWPRRERLASEAGADRRPRSGPPPAACRRVPRSCRRPAVISKSSRWPAPGHLHRQRLAGARLEHAPAGRPTAATGWPFTATIVSPVWMPACAAGLPGQRPGPPPAAANGWSACDAFIRSLQGVRDGSQLDRARRRPASSAIRRPARWQCAATTLVPGVAPAGR